MLIDSLGCQRVIYRYTVSKRNNEIRVHTLSVSFPLLPPTSRTFKLYKMSFECSAPVPRDQNGSDHSSPCHTWQRSLLAGCPSHRPRAHTLNAQIRERTNALARRGWASKDRWTGWFCGGKHIQYIGIVIWKMKCNSPSWMKDSDNKGNFLKHNSLGPGDSSQTHRLVWNSCRTAHHESCKCQVPLQLQWL